MVNSELGDCVFHDDPTVTQLEEHMASLFGKERAMFFPTGTMANTTALMHHCKHKGEAAIVGNTSHVYNWERGAAAAVASVFPIGVQNQPDGTLDLDEVDLYVRGHDNHWADVKLIAVESPHNGCGGIVLKPAYLRGLKKYARAKKLSLHFDGARALNAAGYLGITPAEMCKDFDTVSVCLSKGIGAPFGSVLIGPGKYHHEWLSYRKMLGGGLRQAGIAARAALENLKTWEEQVQKEHRQALHLASALQEHDCLELAQPAVETNMFYMRFKEGYERHTPTSLVEAMREKHGVLVCPSLKDAGFRLVCHRDISDSDVDKVIKLFKEELK